MLKPRDVLKRIPGVLPTRLILLGLGSSPHDRLRNELSRHLAGREDLFFVQVGAGDGTSEDPLHHLIAAHDKWRGIFIEPVGSLLMELRHTYAEDSRFAYENVAIDRYEGTRRLYYIDRSLTLDRLASAGTVPRTYFLLGSFDVERLSNLYDGVLRPHIQTTEVRCLPFDHLLKSCEVDKIDLLVIDTEGHDLEILSQLDFRVHKPSIIVYEHKHLTQAHRETAVRILRDRGYTTRSFAGDTLALHRVTTRPYSRGNRRRCS